MRGRTLTGGRVDVGDVDGVGLVAGLVVGLAVALVRAGVGVLPAAVVA
jgi:hypothetical protein